MNAAEIEDEISKLAAAQFDAREFPYQFLQAFGVNETALAKLKAGRDNKSDVPDGVLQRARNNIHLKTCPPGLVADTLVELRNSEATKKLKARYILATDGQTIAAERLRDGETLACDYQDLPNHFGILLDLAGISTTPRIEENTFDIRATSKLNKLYVELLRHNPDWGADARRQDLNHFFARLIFCFFAEDTNIFTGGQLFTSTVEQYTDRTGVNVHEVVAEVFRAMDTRREERATTVLRPYALKFPYVNGNLFGGVIDTPRFTQAARIYLLAVGNLDWKKINPDIFGSMIQAVADDEERGALGMHYTSVPNILKVLNPLFLDDLRAKLDEAGDGKTPGSARKLLNLRNRLARIRVFDPACGSGNFLVIGYKEMRQIEAIINERRGERDIKSVIPISNFRGIEIRSFPAEIARLALIIAEFQCDVLHRGELLARDRFLPLEKANWIVCGNALRLDWLTICPPTGAGVKLAGDDLFNTPLDQAEIDFENQGGETFICGNPPYKGRNKKGAAEREETDDTFAKYPGSFASLDYVANWIIKAAEYCKFTTGAAGLVATNSVCQGEQVALLWPLIFARGVYISFAHASFRWSNLASDNAGVTVIVVGLSRENAHGRPLYSGDDVRLVDKIGPYLVPHSDVIVAKREAPISKIGMMYLGNMAKDGGNLIMSPAEGRTLIDEHDVDPSFIRKFYGSEELIHSQPRACLWIDDSRANVALENAAIVAIVSKVRQFRSSSKAPSTRQFASVPHRFVQLSAANGERVIIVPRVSSESRPYLPVDYFAAGPIIGDKCYALYDEPLWNLALIASRLHLVWIGTVCSRLEMRFSYGNKLGWNTFPVPKLTDQNKADLTRCAEDILLAREAHFPATIAELYAPGNADVPVGSAGKADGDVGVPRGMPPDLRAAHDRNDETLERIYIGRRFRNDTERLEKLFELYTQMTARQAPLTPKGPKKPGGRKVKGADE